LRSVSVSSIIASNSRWPSTSSNVRIVQFCLFFSGALNLCLKRKRGHCHHPHLLQCCLWMFLPPTSSVCSLPSWFGENTHSSKNFSHI
jgi:hypothetical protein